MAVTCLVGFPMACLCRKGLRGEKKGGERGERRPSSRKRSIFSLWSKSSKSLSRTSISWALSRAAILLASSIDFYLRCVKTIASGEVLQSHHAKLARCKTISLLCRCLFTSSSLTCAVCLHLEYYQSFASRVGPSSGLQLVMLRLSFDSAYVRLLYLQACISDCSNLSQQDC